MVRADRVHHFTATGTSVELDAASQVEATSAMASRGQIAVGWYEIVGNGWPQHTLFLKTCGQRQQTTHSHAYPIHSRFTPRYHSHPVFEARPSQKDNENQRNYQALCHDASTGLAPWVGVIISPYLPSLPSPVGVLASIGDLAVFGLHHLQKLSPFPFHSRTNRCRSSGCGWCGSWRGPWCPLPSGSRAGTLPSGPTRRSACCWRCKGETL